MNGCRVDSPQILVVDDTPASLNLLTKILTEHGYQVRSASSGRLALRSTAVEAPDLILLDVKMPDMDGYDVCRYLKSKNEYRGIPVIFVSALDEADDKLMGFNAGGADYITKPFQAAEVLARVGTHLALRSLQRQMEAQNAQLQVEIAERKRAEEDIRQLNAVLEQKVEERTRQLFEAREELVRKEKLSILGQLAGTVGHELRNPLGVMSNAVYLLKIMLPEANETTKEYLDIIMKEIDNSTQIITDLLDFARTKTPQVETVLPRELINDCAMRCAVPDNVEFQVDIPNTLPALKVDPLQMRQVLQNLIMNGIQAMPGGGSLRISARKVQGTEEKNINPSEDFIKISVSDTGTGISEDGLKRLFQPLFTTKPRGIGLGLTVCKNLMEVNDGRIEVESRVGEGTTFTITLPVERKGQ